MTPSNFFLSFNNANLDRRSVDKLYPKIPARIRLSPIFLCSDRINGMFVNYRSACIKVISPMFPYCIYGVVWTSDWLILPFMCLIFFVSFACFVRFSTIWIDTHTKWYQTQVSMSCQLPTNSVWIVCLFWYDYEITSWQICFFSLQIETTTGKKMLTT